MSASEKPVVGRTCRRIGLLLSTCLNVAIIDYINKNLAGKETAFTSASVGKMITSDYVPKVTNVVANYLSVD